MSHGIIYIVRNPRLGDHVVKVGKTNRSADERIAELNSPTSNLGRFELIAAFPVHDIDRAERDCHAALSKFREQANREFFCGDLGKIVEVVQTITQAYAPKPIISPNVLSETRVDQSAPVRSMAERISQSKNRQASEAQSRATEVDRFNKEAEKLSSVIRNVLREILIREGGDIFRIPDKGASVFESWNFRDFLLSSLADRANQGKLSPIARARLSQTGMAPADHVTLLLQMFRFSQPAIEDLRLLGRICPEGAPIPLLIVFSRKPRELQLLKEIDKNCWIFGNCQCALYPLQNENEAADQFLQVIADAHAIKLCKTEYNGIWGDYVTQSVFEKKPKVISNWFKTQRSNGSST